MSEGIQPNRQKLLDEFDAVMLETEQLLKAIAGSGESDMSGTARAKLQQSLRDAKERLLELEKTLVKHSRDAVRAADDYVHENPWRSVGIAAGVGFLLGILLSRR